MSSEWEAIAARCEAASGPDPKLDAHVWHAVTGPRWTESDFAQLAGSSWFAHRYGVPAYTASLDAIVALIGEKLPGWRGDVDVCPFEPGDRCGARLFPPPPKITNILGEAATPALALCAAFARAMHARAQSAERQGGERGPA